MSANEEFEVTIRSDTAEAREVQERIVAKLEEQSFPMRDVFGVRLALEEALVNAIKHGNRMDPSKTVRILCQFCEDDVKIEIEDQGAGFDVHDVPDPTEDENLDKPGGRGIMLMRSFMSSIEYNETGNILMMTKQREVESAEVSDD